MIITKIKDLLPYRARLLMGKFSRRVRYAYMVSIGKREMVKTCSVCDRNLVGFVHGGKLCPFCASFPRHRMLWPLIHNWLEKTTAPDLSVLLVAPDACLRDRLVKHPNANYQGLDMFTSGHYYPPDTIEGNIEATSLAADHFDLIVCSHVLEHVDNDLKAMREICRILKPGGCALLAFPFRPGTLTYEDKSIIDPQDRARAFGQWDHVRFYGEDAVDRMKDAGFEVQKLQASDLYSTIEVVRLGLQDNEVFFLCRKSGEVSSLCSVDTSKSKLQGFYSCF